MRTRGRRRASLKGLLALLGAVLAVPIAPGAQVAGGLPEQVAEPPALAGPGGVLPADGSWTLTLLTGDVLHVRSDAEGRVTASVEEQTGPFRTYRKPDGELYVIPLSVTGLVANVLDLELFNVTGLVRQGFDDESIDSVPLIVQRQPGVDVRGKLSSEGERPLPSIGAAATEVPKADAAATGELLAELDAATDAQARAVSGISKVWLDRRTKVQSSTGPAQAAPPAGNITQIGADRAWADGLSGAGVTVAVLDSGVDATHPDLAGRVIAEENFGGAPDVVDRAGHGTHVASIAVGTGAASGGERSGVAPAASLISGKVTDDDGWGLESEAIAGMEWAAPQADVINMSLGYGMGSDGSDPISLALDALTEQHDTLFVVAAGNAGPGGGTVAYPGAADQALTVGAVDAQDVMAPFSSRGPLANSFEVKPEVVAPGVDIVAARAAEAVLGDPVDEHYSRMSGTSMASPHAAGSAALLAQLHPDWTAGQLKNALVATSDPIDGGVYVRGGGRIDVGDGADAVVRSDRDVLDMVLPYPQTEPRSETLSWTNTGTDPLTVELSAELEETSGEPASGLTVEPASLTIAPGATASATVVADGPTLDTGLYSGTVIADPVGGAEADDVRTPVGVYDAPEMVELTIEATAPPGGADVPPDTFAVITNLDDYALFNSVAFFEESLTLQVPVGTYAVTGDVSTTDGDAEAVAQVGDPEIVIDADTTVAFDGDAAVPFVPAVPDVDTAAPMLASSNLQSIPRAGAGGYAVGTAVYSWHPMPTLRVTPMAADPELFLSHQIYRLQAAPLAATVGGDAIEIVRAGRVDLPAGTVRLRAFDGGDGSDLSGAAGGLAVVDLPADLSERAAVTQRALEAGVAVVAFVDEKRSFLTLGTWQPVPWADLPVIAVAGDSAARLRAAAAGGERVTVKSQASPYVFDIVSPDSATLDPEPVVDVASLALLRERFHRDPDGLGSESDRRYPISHDLMNLDSEGPLPERRKAYVSPGVTWLSMAIGTGWFRLPWEPEPVSGPAAMAFDTAREYEPGSSQTLRWLSRPMWAGPVGAPEAESSCQPVPVQRTDATMQVWLAPFQDRPDGYGCGDPHTSRLVLERDGVVVGETDQYFAEFDVPAGEAAFRLSYEQTGFGPYKHRSTSAWTFRSAAPGPLPLLVVDYDLPLDTLNRPTSRTATFKVDQVTGAADSRVTALKVWTSTNAGTSWRSAPVSRIRAGRYEVTLPGAAAGTPVSIRVDAVDAAGSRIEQTLIDAYVA